VPFAEPNGIPGTGVQFAGIPTTASQGNSLESRQSRKELSMRWGALYLR